MAVVKLAPSDIFFSQDSISNRFGKSTPHRLKFIGETLDDILSGKCSIYDIPAICVINKEGVWVTADNRRLWVFKKLQLFGECDEVIVTVTSYLNPKKDRVLSTTQVRGREGGSLWIRYETSKRRAGSSLIPQHSSMQADHFSIPFSLDSLSIRDRPEVQHLSAVSSAESCSSFAKFSSDLGHDSKKRSSKYSGATAKCSNPETDPRLRNNSSNRTTTSSASKHSLSPRETEPSKLDYSYSTGNLYMPRQRTQYRSLRSQEDNSTSLVEPVCPKYSSKLYPYSDENSRLAVECVKTQCLTVDRQKPVISLKPLDVGFAGDTGLFLSFDGDLMGKMMDKWFENLSQSKHISMNVFMYREKYYSIENAKLWKCQALDRFTGDVRISGMLIPKPYHYSLYGLHDSLISTDKIDGEKWKSFVTLNSLPTKRSLRLDLSDILYTTSTIQDTFKGRSIAGKLVEIFTSGKRNHELNVMEYENKYYTLENKKLWILKHAEKVLGKFTITGHIKISMDYILFHSFMTTETCIQEVDVSVSSDTHTDEEKFILKYIHKVEKHLD